MYVRCSCSCVPVGRFFPCYEVSHITCYNARRMSSVDNISSTSCDAVRGEISKRVNGQYGSWYDPHNNGTYSITDSSSSDSMSLSRLTGDKKYTDKMIFSYAVMASGGCDVTACSESQVTSLLDYATNYCNVHNLYCSDDSCKPFTKLAYTETVGKCSDSTVASCFSA